MSGWFDNCEREAKVSTRKVLDRAREVVSSEWQLLICALDRED